MLGVSMPRARYAWCRSSLSPRPLQCRRPLLWGSKTRHMSSQGKGTCAGVEGCGHVVTWSVPNAPWTLHRNAEMRYCHSAFSHNIRAHTIHTDWGAFCARALACLLSCVAISFVQVRTQSHVDILALFEPFVVTCCIRRGPRELGERGFDCVHAVPTDHIIR